MNDGNKEIPFCEQESNIKREIYTRNIIKCSPCTHQTSKGFFSNILRGCIYVVILAARSRRTEVCTLSKE